jgi:hypothetical protein
LDDSSITTTDTYSSYAENRSIRRQPFFNVSRVSLTRSPHQESYAKMQQEDEEDFDRSSISYISDKRTHQQRSEIYNIEENPQLSDDNHHHHISSYTNNENGEEMILTAAKLTPLITDISSTTNTSRC